MFLFWAEEALVFLVVVSSAENCSSSLISVLHSEPFWLLLAPLLTYFLLQVDAPCRIERAKDPLLQDHVFSCDVSHGVVPAKGKLVLCIRFQPQTVGEHSTDYFTIVSAGCLLQTVLKVVGLCKGTRMKVFLVSSCLVSAAGEGQVLGEGLGAVTALSHILTFC